LKRKNTQAFTQSTNIIITMRAMMPADKLLLLLLLLLLKLLLSLLLLLMLVVAGGGMAVVGEGSGSGAGIGGAGAGVGGAGVGDGVELQSVVDQNHVDEDATHCPSYDEEDQPNLHIARAGHHPQELAVVQ
jgi:hypothetical protein